MTTKVKKVKAFIVLTNSELMEWAGLDRRVAIYETESRAQERVSDSPDTLQIVPCTITYHLPHTPKRPVSKSK